MAERAGHEVQFSYHETDHEVSGFDPGFECVRMTLIHGIVDYTPLADVEQTPVSDREQITLPTEDKEVESETHQYKSTYNYEDLSKYTKKHGVAGFHNAHSALHGELTYRYNSKPFRERLKDWGWDDAVGPDATVALPVTVLRRALLTMVAEEGQDIEEIEVNEIDPKKLKLLLRDNSALIRASAFEVLHGYCEAVIKQ